MLSISDKQGGCIVIMKKYNKKLFALLLGILIIVGLYCLLKPPKDRPQIYRNMINAAFGTSLSETNSDLKFSYTTLSRDSVYVIHFIVSDDFITEELKEENGWNNNFDLILQEYIIPYEKYIRGLDLMIKSGQTGQCYYKLAILDEIAENFKIVMINPKEKSLFFFYLTF